jgi:hypothetical protein
MTMSDPANQPSFSTGRRFGVGANVLVAVVALFAVLVMVNYLAARHYRRVHTGTRGQQPLSPQTLGVLAGLTNDVRVVVLFDRDEALYPQVNALLNEYRHASARLKVEVLDYVRNPAAAALLKSQYKLVHLADKDLVLFDCAGRVRVVYLSELSDYDLSDVIEGRSREVRRTAFKGETLFTAALLGVSDPRPIRAGYFFGHGEHNPQDEQGQFGYVKFIGLLNEKNIGVQAVNVLGTNQIPADLDVVIIAGPTDAFSQPELDKIEAYLNRGGRMLVLLNPLVQNVGLERLLAGWGVLAGSNLVLDQATTVMGQDLVAGRFGSHPAVRGLYGTKGVHLMLPRTVDKLPRGANTPDAPKVEELIFTSENAVAVTDFSTGVPRPGPRDRRGSLPVAAAIEKGSLQGVAGDRGATRIVVVGDSQFLGNQMIESAANRDFTSLTLNWLLDRRLLLGGVGPRAVTTYRLNLGRVEMNKLRAVILGALPGGVLLLGALVWWRRRH